ncbi:MAG: hypothetical protein ABI594_12475 [Ginsengibacter sp.]
MKKNNRSTFAGVILNCRIFLKAAKVTLCVVMLAGFNACTKQIKLDDTTSSTELTFAKASVLKGPITDERAEWKQKKHPHWIFSDDFETTDPFVGNGRYFEYDDNGGDFIPMDGVGVNGSRGMRVKWQAGEVSAGGLSLGFGRQTDPYMDQGIRSRDNFREIYYRIYLKMQAGWIGNPVKLSRATILAKNDWSQAMIAHLWQGNGDALGIDPVSGTDSNGVVVTNGYNDFANFKWLGFKSGSTPIFDASHADKWYCIESHVKLNDKGKSNGIQEFWIDGRLEARSDNLNFVSSYTAYGINVIFFENYWNAGSPQDQERYFDNIVVSTKRIGF